MSAAVAGSSVAKAVESASAEGGKAAGGLVSRVFGPAADEIGIALARYTAFRVNNVGRIARAADRKSRGREGIVAPRLAHSVLEDGSWCDDELMADYFGGVLAAGRTPDGRDDRAVAWSKLVTGMSAWQVRAHFIFYREWAIALQGTDIDLGTFAQRARVQMYVELSTFDAALRPVAPDIERNALLAHVLTGLTRLNLIEDTMAAGDVGSTVQAREGLTFDSACQVQMTIPGMELYAWACGIPEVLPRDFASRPELAQNYVDVLRPDAVMPDFKTESD